MLIGKYDRLHSGYLEALAAAHILASHHVVAAQHIGLGFGEAGSIAIIGTAGQLILLGAHQPANFVFGRLLAMRAVQRGWLLLRPFIKKVALFHRVVGSWSLKRTNPLPSIIARRGGITYGKMCGMPKKKKVKRFTAVEAVKTMAREQIGEPPASRVVPNRKKKTEKHKPTLEKLLSDPE